MIQVAPTGFSAFVSPDGEVYDRTSVSEQAVIRHEVPLRAGTTWYTWLGDLPWRLAVLIVLGTTVWAARARPERDVVTDDSLAGSAE